jgi:hypothetical protein
MASEKQIAYIKSLARQLGVPIPDGISTKRGASNTIQDLKRRREQRASKAGA